MAAHLRQLDPEGRCVEGLPGWQDERSGGRTGRLAPHQTWWGAHPGPGAGKEMREDRFFFAMYRFTASEDCLKQLFFLMQDM